MYRARVIPSEEHSSFTFPPELYGQEVEIVSRPVETGSASESEYIPIWKRYPGLNGSELASKAHEEFLSSLTPEELARHKEESSRRWAEADRLDKELGLHMSIEWYRRWRQAAYGYDPDYYKRFNGC
jgi:hypothetical protein